MEDYTPPYKISDKMLESVSSISEKVGMITAYRSFESGLNLRKNNRIRSIHSSLKIEANSLSINEVRDVINGHSVMGDRREILEVKNAYAAYEKIPKINPYSLRDLKMIHGIMTNLTIEESGVFRKGDEGVFSGEKCIFIAPPPNMVDGLMNSLMSWMKKNENSLHPLIMAAVFHYEFVFIHPFSDGNGRMARLWHTVILYRWRRVFEYIPLESRIERFQEQYYEAIAKCHTKGNLDIFIEFMLSMIDQVLDEVILQINKTSVHINEYVKKMLNVMEYDVLYSSKDILDMLGLKSKETLRKNYINPAIELGLIRMTIPDKPRSKNQRYAKEIDV